MSAKYSRIISTGSALPAARITNEDLARRLAADGIETVSYTHLTLPTT